MTAAKRPERVAGQVPLDLGVEPDQAGRPVGRTERLVAAALVAGIDQDVIDPQLDQGAAALAVSLARAVDRGAFDPYAVAAAGRELSALLARLRLDPESRDTGVSIAGETAAWLRRISEPT